MKKITQRITTICLVVLTVILFYSCSSSLPYPFEKLKDGHLVEPINEEMIKSINGVENITKEQIKELVKLYNNSYVLYFENGTTPDYSIQIEFTDGSILLLRDNCSETRLEVDYINIDGKYSGNDNITIINKDLVNFIKELCGVK